MKRVERLTGIISYLQSRNYTSMERLMEKFNVSERSIYRDLASLQEIGVPVSFDKERGYHILDSHFIPPVSFSEEEAIAITLAGRLMRNFSDEQTINNFDNALDKIKYALNSGQKDLVESITDTLSFPMLEQGPIKENRLSAVQSSIVRKRILRISYLNRKGELTEREIEPIGLTFYGLEWHTVAWCWSREAYRDFIISSIQRLEATTHSFRKSDHLTLDDYINELLNSSNV